MKLILSKEAEKNFRKLQHNIQTKIYGKLKYYSQKSDPPSYAKRLTNYSSGKFRFRIGDYRATFDVENDVIYILKIQHRRDIYRNK
jgi:mRNA interferase RelE/StbE